MATCMPTGPADNTQRQLAGLPVLALLGRPNVGKSTLFNRLTRTRDAIVADFPGLTRDRQYGRAKFDGKAFIVIDTGGFEPRATQGIVTEMARQTEQAVAEADVAVFLVDAQAGLSAQDHDIAVYLRRLGKPVVLVANKSEGMQASLASTQFYELGLGEVKQASATHNQGIHRILEAAFSHLPWAGHEEPEPTTQPDGQPKLRLAVAGRPNAGKSTLINTWLGEERLVAFDQPGTTRDAIEIDFEQDGQALTLIDTAGLRRKGRVFESVEKFSVIKTLQAIESANVVVLLLDATVGVGEQDARIAGFALEAGRAMVLAVNKWDAVDDYHRNLLRRDLETRLAFLKFADTHFISAEKNQGLRPLWRSIFTAHRAAHARLPTPQLTRLLHDAIEHRAPPRTRMYRPKMRYAHQGGTNPPVIVIHGNSLQSVPASYRRFLERRFREAFDLRGTPMKVEFKSGRNPYVKPRTRGRPA